MSLAVPTVCEEREEVSEGGGEVERERVEGRESRGRREDRREEGGTKGGTGEG